MTRSLAAAFLLFLSATCFGQTSYMGLTPGASTKADVPMVLGPPVKKQSDTLIEYKGSPNAEKIYVQYRDGSASATIERIELVVCARAGNEAPKQCSQAAFAMESRYTPAGSLDAHKSDSDKSFHYYYFGPPRYMVRTQVQKLVGTEFHLEVRWAFYSKELYEAVAPKGNCIGVLRGEWETNRGHMTVPRDEAGWIRGTYSSNNGTFSGQIVMGFAGDLQGEWKDDTGGGTLSIGFVTGKAFSGTWKRTSGSGPAAGVWEGRCVDSAAGAK